MSISVPVQRASFTVLQFASRAAMGAAAAQDVAARMLELLAERDAINLLFAAAPSQNEFLSALAADPRLDWSRVNAFHLDEYIGLAADAPQGFGNFLRERMFGRVPFRSVHYINGAAEDPEAECRRYAQLLAAFPLDIVCMGIGENGHVAFNDPPVADFGDPVRVKIVALDPVCRQQQVNDGCFARLEQVPTHAFTLTVPALAAAAYHYCIVPAATKADAVYRTVCGPISTDCPATMLRRCADAVLYLDADSAARL